MKRKFASMIMFALLASLFVFPPTAAAQPAQKNVILATTTSTQDSGLLDVLLPIFEKKTGYFVKTIAVGSGQAMAMGAEGRGRRAACPLARGGEEVHGRRQRRGAPARHAQRLHHRGPAGRPGQDQGNEKGRRGLQEDRRNGQHLHVPRRQLGDPRQGEGHLEGRRSEVRGREMVPADGARHGADAGRGGREEDLHARRPGDLPGPARRAWGSTSWSRATRSCSTSTTSSR